MKLNIVGFGIILLVTGIITFSGCTEHQEATYTITIQNSSFDPAELNARPGETIMWVNNDSVPHRVVSDTGAFESPTLNSGDKFIYNVTKEGDYHYHDGKNTSMKGRILVHEYKQL